MIAVALVGLNLGGGIATAKLHRGWANHTRGWSWGRWVRDMHNYEDFLSKEGRGLKYNGLEPDKNPYVFAYDNGTIEIGRGHDTPRQEIKRIVRAPATPTTLQIWSPMIASVLLTVLVLVVPLTRPGLQRRGAGPAGELQSAVRPRRLRLVGRRLMIVSALVGLNLVAARYRRAPDPYDDRLESPLRSTAVIFVKPVGDIEPRPLGGACLVIKPDGFHGYVSFRGRLAATDNGTAVFGAWVAVTTYGTFVSYDDERGRRVRHRDDRIRVLGTIDYKPDGSIVGYEGKPGEMRAPPHVIRPPLQSFLEMWWPIMASASITMLVLGILWRQFRRQQNDLVMQNE
jgi:hypothetical protein